MKKSDKDIHAYDKLDEMNTVASATECTGLIQIPPTNAEELESYTEIYDIPVNVDYEKKSDKKDIEIKKEKNSV